MQISKRENMLITALCVLLILVLGMRFLVAPAYRGWQTKRGELTALEAARLQMTANNADTPTLDNDPKAAAQDMAEFFLPAANTEDFHRFFEKFADANGLTFDNIAVLESGDTLPAGFCLVTVSISMTGSQENLLGFLRSVEDAKKATALGKLDFSPSGGGLILNASYTVYCMESAFTSEFSEMPSQPAPADGFRFLAQNQGGGISEAK